MKLKFDFPQEVRLLYLDCWCCWTCGGNGVDKGGLAIHHIFGRVSDSAFNSSVLCGECHAHIGHTDKEQAVLLNKTLHYLVKKKYEPTDADYEFLGKVMRDHPMIQLEVNKK